MVHDLRNPLAAISGCAELLATRELGGEETKRIASNVWRASQQIQTILGEFLSCADERHESRTAHNLRAVLSASCEAAGVHLRPDIELAIDVSEAIVLPLDPVRMGRVFLNLIINSMEAMPRGGAIHIAAFPMADHVRVTFEDTGSGIPPPLRHRLFEPFVTAGKADGVGLGLAISRETVRRHGGELWLENARGARFVMRLPGAAIAGGQQEQK
jgi:signal transduction histidine kinase